MYFLVALVGTIISFLLWFFFKDRKGLHLDILAIIFGSSTIMWLIDVIYTVADGEAPFGFEPRDGWISLWTIIGCLFLWLMLSFIFNNKDKRIDSK